MSKTYGTFRSYCGGEVGRVQRAGGQHLPAMKFTGNWRHFYSMRTHYSMKLGLVDFQRVMKRKPQWNNPDPCKDNPHREEPENRSNLCGHFAVAR